MSLIGQLEFLAKTPTKMHCDTQAVNFIINNLTFHGHIKNVVADYHLIEDKGIVEPNLYSIYFYFRATSRNLIGKCEEIFGRVYLFSYGSLTLIGPT